MLIGAACVAVAVTALAVADPQDDIRRWHAKAEAEMTQVAADACGRHVTTHIEWQVLDTLDYAKADEEKSDAVGAVSSTLESLHDGLARACEQDPAVKAMLASVDTIDFVPTDDKTFALDASLAGSTLVLTDYIWGSTRDIDDFAHAIRDAKPPPAPKATRPIKLGTPSRRWDAIYRISEGPETSGGLCFRGGVIGDIKVAGGRFTIPWKLDDFRKNFEDLDEVPVLDAGKIDVVVHADGTGVGIVTFTNPALSSREPRTMKLKRRLDTVRAIAFKFFKTDDGRAFTFSIQIPGMDSCDYRWDWADPKIAAARHAAWERAEAAKSPAQRAAEHRAAARASKCRDSCDQHEQTCNGRCSTALSTCKDSCSNVSDDDERTTGCPDRCDSANSTCSGNCTSDDSSCTDECDHP